MCADLGRTKFIEKYLSSTLNLFRESYKKTPKIDYKNKITELEKLC